MKAAGFEFPEDLHYLVEQQTWARLHGDGTATVGITSLGIHQAGDIYMARPKGIGADVEAGRSIAVVELAKSIVSVKSPVSGVVLEVNGALEERPELVHLDCYGAGWLARLRLTAEPQLVHGEAVGAAMERHAWLHRAEGAGGDA